MDVDIVNGIVVSFSLIVEILLIRYYVGKKFLPIKNNLLFLQVLKISVAVSLANLISVGLDYLPNTDLSIKIHYFANIIYFILYEISFLYFADYIMWNSNKQKTFMNSITGNLSIVFVAIFTIATLLLVDVFYIDEFNKFHLGKYVDFANIFPLSILLLSTARFIKSQRKNLNLRNKGILYSSIILILGTMSDNLVDDLILGDFFYSLSMLILYIACENPERFKSEKINCFDLAAFEVFIDELIEEKKEFYVYCVEVRNFDTIRSRRGLKTLYKALSNYVKWIYTIFPNDYLFFADNRCFNLVTFKKIDEKKHDNFIAEIKNKAFSGGELLVYLWSREIQVDVKNKLCKNASYILNGEAYVIEGFLNENQKLRVDEEIYKKIYRESEIYNVIDRSIKENTLKIYIQPFYNTQTGTITEGEILSRIQDEKYGLVMPYEFIPLAEKSGMITELGYMIFKKTCDWISKNNLKELGINCINVNCSPVEFQDLNLSDKLKKIADDYKIDFSMFKFEVTESYIANSDIMRIHIDKFKNYGASIAMDDFGDGSSNLSRLLQYEFDTAKIDMSLVWSYFYDNNLMLEDVVEMFKKANLKIVAEGVESEEIANSLAQMGCDYLQGYYFSKPIPVEELQAYLEDFKLKKINIYKPQIDKYNMLTRLNNNSIFYSDETEYSTAGMYVCLFEEPYHLESISQGLCAMLGYKDKDDFIKCTKNYYRHNILEEDLTKYNEFLNKVSKPHAKETLIYRMLKKDGTIIFVLDINEAVEREDGTVVGYSSVIDITNLIKLENELIISNEKYKRLYNSIGKINKHYKHVINISGLCFFEYNLDAGYFILGKEVEDVLMYTPKTFYDAVEELRDDDFSGKIYGDIYYLIHKDDREVAKKSVVGLDERLSTQMEVRLFCGDRQYHWVKIDLYLSKKERWAIGCIQNTDEVMNKLINLQEQNKKEPMTGTLNKITAFTEIKDYFKNGPHTLDALSIFDIDNFKILNDSLGYAAGDKIIKYLADGILSVYGKDDIIARFGNDEFFVYTKDIKSKDIALQKAKKLQEICKKCPYTKTSGFTVSAGITYACPKLYNKFIKKHRENKNDDYNQRYVDEMFDVIFKEANKALYRVKDENKGEIYVEDCNIN